MADAAFVASVLFFFAIALGFALVCDHLERGER